MKHKTPDNAMLALKELDRRSFRVFYPTFAPSRKKIVSIYCLTSRFKLQKMAIGNQISETEEYTI